MIKRIIQWFFALLGGIAGFQLGDPLGGPLVKMLGPIIGVESPNHMSFFLLGIGAIIMFFSGYWIVELALGLTKRMEEKLSHIPGADLFAGIFGLIVGLVISALVYPSIQKLGAAGPAVSVLLTAVLGFLGFRIGYQKRDDFAAAWSRSGKDKKNDGTRIEEHKILDTSVIIDGRIADICKTGFIEGTLVIPEFVLEELQHIADSSDLLKRNRGRRGLDILNKIQKELDVKVLIYEGDFEEISEVDSKLVKLAKVLKGKVVTNDFNLNKVCELQGVSVLNINDLANAVKPVVLPGEEILVQVIKDGKEYGQGVAYLDDGTMIVVEGGRDFIGANLEVLVTSVLQTSAGRMIFAKPKLLEKAQ